MPTKIPYAERNWETTGGCEKIGAGCKNCYAIPLIGRRFAKNPIFKGRYKGLVRDGNWTGKIKLFCDRLRQPLHRTIRTTYFVNSRSDLFHKGVSFEFIDEMFFAMARCPQHTFLLFTKRWGRAAEYFADERMVNFADGTSVGRLYEWPLPNVHLFFSVSTQRELDEALPIPGVRRGLSLEPLLEALPMLGKYLYGGTLNCHACHKTFNSWEAEFCGGHECAACAGARSIDDCCFFRSCTDDQTLLCPHCDKCACGKERKWFNGDKLNEGEGGWGYVHKDLKWGRLIDQVIVGCESGPNQRPCKIEWIRDIVRQCQSAKTKVYIKQMEVGGKVCSDVSKFPKDLQVRNM